MRERMKKKKNMIIGGLLALIFLMSVGYAAFASNLTINGTANTSSWIIKITNIREKTHTGGADTVNTSFTDLSATFSSTLTQPGDSITYEVTVENQGNTDAMLKEVTKTFTNNTYIDVTYSGLVKGQMLYKQGGAGSSAVMEVTITFKDLEIESLTDTITSNITISLDFAQEGNNVDTIKKYLVEYDSEGGTAVENRYYKWTDKGMAVSANTTKVGYDFGGWWTRPYSSGIRALASRQLSELMANVSKDENDDGLTLYAAWTAKRYNIIYNSQGAEDPLPEQHSWDSTYIIPTSSPYKDGYDIEGWHTSPNGQGMKIDNYTTVSDVVQKQYGKYNDIAGGNNGDEITLYANWIAKQYTITFDSREGSAVSDMTATWDQSLVLPSNPTREGYTFGGWYSKTPSSKTGEPRGVLVTNGSKVSDFAKNDIEDTPKTLYAYWIAN